MGYRSHVLKTALYLEILSVKLCTGRLLFSSDLLDVCFLPLSSLGEETVIYSLNSMFYLQGFVTPPTFFCYTSIILFSYPEPAQEVSLKAI